LQVEKFRYEAERAERRYRTVEPENRLVARTLETEWEQRLSELGAAETELARRQRQRAVHLTEEQRTRIRTLGTDLTRLWKRQQPLTGPERVAPNLGGGSKDCCGARRLQSTRDVALAWGVISELDVNLRSCRVPPIRTDEDTIQLVRRLAVHYPDAVIAVF